MTTIKVELGVAAQKFIQQIQLHNGTIEDQIAKGIELALQDITEGDNFIQAIRESTKSELAMIVNKAVMSWEVRSKISKLVEEKIGKKVEEYADKIAERVTETLTV